MNIRVGEGWDVHALVAGRKLIIGGVEIPFHLGLLGHSDADVLLHAICDALLGAAGLGDIGAMFPDTDERYRGADSMRLLDAAWARVRAEGWRLGNLDCTVVAQQPKIAPYVDAMRTALATALDVEKGAVSVKGKTTEKLGFTGRGEGIAAMVSALLTAD